MSVPSLQQLCAQTITDTEWKRALFDAESWWKPATKVEGMPKGLGFRHQYLLHSRMVEMTNDRSVLNEAAAEWMQRVGMLGLYQRKWPSLVYEKCALCGFFSCTTHITAYHPHNQAGEKRKERECCGILRSRKEPSKNVKCSRDNCDGGAFAVCDYCWLNLQVEKEGRNKKPRTC